MSTAVQIFDNLGMLTKAIESTTNWALMEIERAGKEALDVSLQASGGSGQDMGKRGGPGRAALPSPGSSGNVRTRLWENLERLFQETVYARCAHMELLEGILMEHRTSPSDFEKLSKDFWQRVMTILAKVFLERAQGSSELSFDRFTNDIVTR